MKGKIIAMMEKLFATNPLNYFIVEEMAILPAFINVIETLSQELQVQVLRILRFIISGISYVPMAELRSLSAIYQG